MDTQQTARRVIGLCGAAGAGKNTAADLIHVIAGHEVVALADPIYAAVSAMLGIPVKQLQDRRLKEQPIEWLGVSPRRLLQTLGTEWGRDTIRQDIWVTIARERARKTLDAGRGVVFCDVRFDDEAKMIRDDLGGEVWKVIREPQLPRTPIASLDGEAATHSSEAGVSDELIDATLMNVGGTMLLMRQIQGYLARQYHAA